MSSGEQQYPIRPESTDLAGSHPSGDPDKLSVGRALINAAGATVLLCATGFIVNEALTSDNKKPAYDYMPPPAAVSPRTTTPPPTLYGRLNEPGYTDGVNANGLSSCATEVFLPSPSPSVAEQPTQGEILTNDGKIITLEPDPATGNPVGEPGLPSTEVLDHIKSSIVEITIDGASGSGVMIAPGVMLTAAHMLEKSGAVVTNAQGKTARVKTGCYLYETNGHIGVTAGEKVADVDLAIVVLEPNGSAEEFAEFMDTTGSIELADEDPQPGDWLVQANTQGDTTIEDPAIYSALYTTGPDGPRIVSGIAPNGSPDYQRYTMIGGASGGAVIKIVNGKPYVVGISFSSLHDPFSYNTDNGTLEHGLMRASGVVIKLPEGKTTDNIHWYPDMGRLVLSSTIRKVMALQQVADMLQQNQNRYAPAPTEFGRYAKYVGGILVFHGIRGTRAVAAA